MGDEVQKRHDELMGSIINAREELRRAQAAFVKFLHSPQGARYRQMYPDYQDDPFAIDMDDTEADE